MARDDDDDDDRPRKRRRDDDDDEGAFEDDRRSHRGRRDDDDDDEDYRPRKKRRYDDEDDDDDRNVRKLKKKAMPGMLLAAGIVAIAWGGLSLLSSCGAAGKSFNDWHNLRQVERMMGGMIRFAGITPGLFLTLGIAYGVMVLASALLALGGILLLVRNKFGKYLSMAGPVLMCLVGLAGCVTGIIVTRGEFFGAAALMGLPGIVFFSLCVGGFLIFALMQDNVNRALK